MSNVKEVVSKTLFDKLYDGAEDVLKTLKKPMAERKLKRKFESALDSATGIIDTAEYDLLTEREKLMDCDINVLLELRKSIKEATLLQAEVKLEYKALFGEDLD